VRRGAKKAMTEPIKPDPLLVVKSVIGRLPQVSVVAVVLTAVFNVGYYQEIGLHFIGTVDFTNFVYSFALVFGVLLGGLQTIFSIVDASLKFSASPEAAWTKLRKPGSLAFGLIGGAMLLLGSLPADYTPISFPRIGNPWWSVLVSTTAAVPYLMAAHLWLKLNILTLFDVGSVLFMIGYGLFSWGQAIAHEQVFSTRVYKIITHDSVIDGATLVRSSSAGFIIALDGKIMFLPSAEIRQIIAETKIKP
jgi:hypothetical protein